MPKQFHPRKRGVHRVACIALYRALLSKCPRIDIPEHLQRGRIHPVAEIVQKQFRRNAQFESQTLIVAALKVGYEAEELLHNVINGNADASTKMRSLLEAYQAQSNATRAFEAAAPPPSQKRHIYPAPRPSAPSVSTILIHPRPTSEITGSGGVRKIPKLVVANGFPFLRYRKPQSPFLTRVIRDKIAKRLKMQTLMGRMEGEVGDEGSVASRENEWERALGERGKGNGWKEVYDEALRGLKERIRGEARAVKELSRRMTGILLEERRLAGEERQVADREKEREKRRVRRLMKTEKERRRRNEYFDSLSPKDRDEAVAKFRRELAEKKLGKATGSLPKEKLEYKATASRQERKEERETASLPKEEKEYKATPSRQKRKEERERLAQDAAGSEGITVAEWRARAQEKSKAEGTHRVPEEKMRRHDWSSSLTKRLKCVKVTTNAVERAPRQPIDGFATVYGSEGQKQKAGSPKDGTASFDSWDSKEWYEEWKNRKN